MGKRLAVVLLCLVGLLTPRVHGENMPISAASYVVMDGDTGRVLDSRLLHERRPIASITKLMTALTAVESGCSLEEAVEVQEEWTGIEGSSIYLRPGECITLESLLYGLLLRSGNDAAVALAEHCGGTMEAFVCEMNRLAQALNMVDSHFCNPHGLHEDAHYSSAYDMALLARACLKDPVLSEMIRTKSITIGQRNYTNHNKLLWWYPGCIGLKTGYTERAGRTLVSAARRDKVTLICVTLHAPKDWNDHRVLYDRCFQDYTNRQLTAAGSTVARVPVRGSLQSFCPAVLGKELSLLCGERERPELRCRYDRELLEAPIRQGQKIGEAYVELDGVCYQRTPLLAGCTIQSDIIRGRGFRWPWDSENRQNKEVAGELWKSGCKN